MSSELHTASGNIATIIQCQDPGMIVLVTEFYSTAGD